MEREREEWILHMSDKITKNIVTEKLKILANLLIDIDVCESLYLSCTCHYLGRPLPILLTIAPNPPQ
jgi:hypothetical protein